MQIAKVDLKGVLGVLKHPPSKILQCASYRKLVEEATAVVVI